LETSKGEHEAFYEKCHIQKAKELEDNRDKHAWMFLRTDIT